MKLFLLLIFVISFPLFAQVDIKGQLLEKGTRNPLKDVNVYILPHKLKAITDINGEFKFTEVPDGEFEFIVNLAGYLRLTQKSNTKTKKYDLYIEKEVYDVFETTVTALADKRDVTKKSLTQKDFIKAPGAQEDPVKAVQNLPGIANQSVSAQVVIQGSSPDDTRYTLNGHEIPIVFHFGGLSSIIMPQAIESVDFLASGFGPEYGRALGGIINLTTRDPKNDRWHGMAFVDLYNAGALAEGPIDDKSSAFISARQSYIGEVLAKVAEDNEDFNLTVAPTFSDQFFQYNRKLNDQDDFSFIAVRSKDELQFVLNEPINNDPLFRGDFYQRTEFYRVIPRFKRQISETQSIDISLGYGDNNVFAEIGDNYFDLNTTTFSQRAEYKHEHSDNFTQFIGLDSQTTEFNVGLKFPERSEAGVTGDTFLSEIEGQNSEQGLYLRNIYALNEKIILSPNLRLSSYRQTNETYLMPRASISYQAKNDWTFSLASGVYYQAPQNGEATKERGNPKLNSERAYHYNLGVDKDFRKGSSNGFIAEFDFFYKKLEQLIVNTTDKNQSGENKVYSNEGVGDITGIQSLIKWRKNEFNLMLAYTYLKSLRNEPEKDEYPSEFDQTHNLNLIASYERSRWTYSTRIRYVTGSPYTPVDGAIFDSDNDVYVPIQGQFYSERYDPFFQLDLRFDRKWVYNTWILSAYLDIQNVTNNKNVQSISYNYDYSDKVETSALPILPIFGVKGEF